MNGSYLYAPAPSSLPPFVSSRLPGPVIDHQSAQYSRQLMDTTRRLKVLMGLDEGDVFVIPASGTGGIECAALNLTAPADRVVVCVNGQFGARISRMLAAMGRQVEEVRAAWGVPIAVQDIEAALERGPAACFLVHVESSTGIVNSVDTIGHACAERGIPLVLDAMASCGSMPLNLSAREVACAIASSQKGLHALPGLAILAIGPLGWSARRRMSTAGTLYFDWEEFRQAFAQDCPLSPWTPAGSLMHTLAVSLEMISSAGTSSWFAHRQHLIQATRQAVTNAGFSCIGEESAGSPIIVARPPPAISAEVVLRRLVDEAGIVVGRGQGRFKQQVVRIGTYGVHGEDDVRRIGSALTLAARPMEAAAEVKG